MSITMRFLIAATTALAAATPTYAAVTSQNRTGFTVAYEADVAVAPKAAYDAFVQMASWWNAASHSYSGEGKNIAIDAKPGGCWCETLKDGGFVRHMTVEHAAPGSSLVFSGGLGPLLYMGVSGHLIVAIEAKGTGSHVKMTYAVGGHDPKDFKEIPKVVDGVLDEAFKRYTNYATTGKP